jgi:hypothetical protein
MRVPALTLLGIFVCASCLAAAQQPTTSTSATPLPQQSGQAVAVLGQALQALGPGPVKDVTLTGTVRRIAGSDDENGTAVLKALSTGEAEMDLNLPSGQRSEAVGDSDKGRVGKWTGPDGQAHAISLHNLMLDSAWFFPALMLPRMGTFQRSAFTFAGSETLDGRAVEHLTASQQFPNLSGEIAKLFQHLSQVEIYLDSSTLLPVALAFNTHLDNDALVDIPVVVRYSNYRIVNGVQVPFHVQKFMNNSLVLDLQFQEATLNSGLTPSSINAQ